MKEKQQEEIKDLPQTVRDPADGQLKTTLPIPEEKKAEETEEVQNAKIE